MEVIDKLVESQVYGALLLFLLPVIYLMVQAFSKNKTIPLVEGGLPYIGQVFRLIAGSPWDTMAEWMLQYGTIYRFHLFGVDSIYVSDPAMLKIILSTKLSVFKKDTEWTYKPFMVILGNGLVTADGTSWRKQRNLLSSHLRIEILDSIPKMALEAVQRLCIKLDKAMTEGTVVEMAEEFRHLTLQVIAEVAFT